MNILDELKTLTIERVRKRKLGKDLPSLRREAEEAASQSSPPSFQKALAGEGLSFICEIKKASPSKGLIAPDFPYLEIAADYQAGGAAAISVLTEPDRFLGDDLYLTQVAGQVTLPVLRKDFTVDEYQIYEARLLGASAVLLICAITEKEKLREYLQIARSIGLSALVETHDEAEIETALDAGAKIIGVNNRDLRDFSVDIQRSVRLRPLVPSSVLFVSESGIHTRKEISELEKAKVDAVLIGENLMAAKDRKKALAALRGDFENEN